MKIIVATGNLGKVRELKEILGNKDTIVLSRKEAGYKSNPDENGTTFEENALIKSRDLFDIVKKDESNIKDDFCVVADDSGLCVDFLEGAPGIYSARFAGEGASDKDNVNKLLYNLRDAPKNKRSARFVCAAAVIFQDRSEFVIRGEWEGIIGTEPIGENGFGYDPIFFDPVINETAANMSSDVKNRISHRGKAFCGLNIKIMNWRHNGSYKEVF